MNNKRKMKKKKKGMSQVFTEQLQIHSTDLSSAEQQTVSQDLGQSSMQQAPSLP
jgi:hypothetical protein